MSSTMTSKSNRTKADNVAPPRLWYGARSRLAVAPFFVRNVIGAPVWRKRVKR
jgi:hypothetical protein